MPDITTTVKTLDFQMLDADRQDATLIKLDNPKNNITREMVSAAMQPAFANGWFLTTKGSPAMYLGDVTISTSTKVKLDGQDFYVTPSSFTQNWNKQTNGFTVDINVSGATIQGYQYININNQVYSASSGSFPVTMKFTPSIINNGLKFRMIIEASSTPMIEGGTLTFDIILVIQGTQVTVPVVLTITSEA